MAIVFGIILVLAVGNLAGLGGKQYGVANYIGADE